MTTETKTIEKLRKEIPQDEFEYQTLLDCLKGYARPRDKISDLLRKRIIIRVKKGLYVLGDAYRQRPFSREVLGNLIYGPSYISLDYALHYYGLIPERVDVITSVTTGRSRKFSTPIGLFTYRMISLKAFQVGMDRIEIGDGRAFLMATPEKALADKLQEMRGLGTQTKRDLGNYLESDLRIDETGLREMKPENLDIVAQAYGSRRIRLLAETVRGIQTSHRKSGGKERTQKNSTNPMNSKN